MEKVGRNSPCPCGSGKKYKNCHEQIGGLKKGSSRNKVIVGVIIALFFIISALGLFLNKRSADTSPGNAPPGKVWSPEHGHWHDIE